MIANWLRHTESASKLIVFFNGWGFAQNVVAHLKINADTNLLVVSDYRDLDSNLIDFEPYKHRSVIAWSFGVANYAAWQQTRPDIFDTKIAINGTLQGVNRQLGIPKKVVQHTIDTLNMESYREFLNRCFNATCISDLANLTPAISDSELEIKKHELQSIKNRDYSKNQTSKWDHIWISKQDRIFPCKNQIRAWQDHQYSIIDAAHAPFSLWTDWQDLLSSS